MTKNNRKLNMLKVRRCLIIFIAFLILLISFICIKINREKNKYNELTVLLNNEFIDLVNEPIIDENECIFFSKDDVEKIFDNTIYYNEL